MKTRHIIAIGLLTAVAVGILAFGIKHNKVKPKVMQTNAYDSVIQYTYGENGGWRIVGDSYNVEVKNPYTDPVYNRLRASYSIVKSPSNEYGDEYYRLDISYHIKAIVGENCNIVRDTNKTSYALLPKSKTINWIEINVNCTYEITIQGMSYWAFDIIATITNTDSTTNAITTYYEYAYEQGTQQFYAYQNQPLATIQVNQTIETLENAYQTGAQNAHEANTGIVDIRGLMLNILTMPFTFISQAFDVTLWEGTAYEFHLAPFIKGMIAILTILFIIRLFTSGFSIIGNYASSAENRRLKRSQTKLNKAKTNLANRTNPNHKTTTNYHIKKD